MINTIKFNLLTFLLCCSIIDTFLLAQQSTVRERRELPMYFLSSGLLNIIFGIGTPVENLDYESVTNGLIIRAQYFLPNLPTDVYDRSPEFIHKRAFSSRWHAYKYFEMLLEKLGHRNGNVCLLRSICEVAAVPFDIMNGLFFDIAHIIFAPSSTYDGVWLNDTNEYQMAEQRGRSGNLTACAIYNKCSSSVIDRFTQIFEH